MALKPRNAVRAMMERQTSSAAAITESQAPERGDDPNEAIAVSVESHNGAPLTGAPLGHSNSIVTQPAQGCMDGGMQEISDVLGGFGDRLKTVGDVLGDIETHMKRIKKSLEVIDAKAGLLKDIVGSVLDLLVEKTRDETVTGSTETGNGST